MNYDTIKQIKEWRIKHGVSQRQLAAKAGFSRNTYASWENNRRKANHKVIWRLQNTIFAWGENDYIQTRNETPAKPEQTTIKKKSIMFRIGYFFGKIVRFIIISIWFILKKLYIVK